VFYKFKYNTSYYS